MLLRAAAAALAWHFGTACSYGSYSDPCLGALAPCANVSSTPGPQSWLLHDPHGTGDVDLVSYNGTLPAPNCFNVYGCATSPSSLPIWMWGCAFSRSGGCEGDQANQVWRILPLDAGAISLQSSLTGSAASMCLAANGSTGVAVVACNASATEQRFKYDAATGALLHVDSGMCVTDSGPAPPPPPPPQAYTVPSYNAVPLWTVDLASASVQDTTWNISVDGGLQRSVGVPFGGYNSDDQAHPWMSSYATTFNASYTRVITIPADSPPSARIFIEFGSVAYGGEAYLSPWPAASPQIFVGSHHGPMMPWAADVTNVTSPGGSYLLTVVTHPFTFYEGAVPSGFMYVETWQPNNGWAARMCNGICKWVRLAAYPIVHITDVIARTSVTYANATFIVEVANDGDVDASVSLAFALSSWNGAAWTYPTVPTQTFVPVPAHNRVSVNVTVPWSPPAGMLWWPNRPFREDYIAQLHWVNVSLTAVGMDGVTAALDTHALRFGFVEHAEGPFFYTINGVRFNQLSDATPEPGMSYFDCYSSAEAFLLPTGAGTGVHETWRRYMRIGMTSNRIHQSTPTEMMLLAADEVGFLLKPETGIRGCGTYVPCEFGTLILQAAAELARVSRNHPSVVAYSVQNEGADAIVAPLADAMYSVDPMRPFTSEGTGSAGVWYNGTQAHAIPMLHYATPPSGDDGVTIVGIGECAWCVSNGMEQFSAQALSGRRNDYAYTAGWDWMNYWPNFLQGMNASRHAWHQSGCNGTDRVDGVDGWGSPVVTWVQQAFHPFLALDDAFSDANPIFVPGWPTQVPPVTVNASLPRTVTLFNDGLTARNLTLSWTLAWVNATGASGGSGQLPPVAIEAGYRATVAVAYTVPSPPAGVTLPAALFWLPVVTDAATKDVLFNDTRQYYLVTA